MKFRKGYVSNSSSASFVVYNWFDIPQEKRDFIKNYDENALKVWKDNNIPFVTENKYGNVEYWFCDYMVDSIIDTNLSDNLYDKLYDKYTKFGFGIVNNGIKFEFEEHKERNTCTIKSSMDNFEMDKWLEYNQVDFDELEYFA